MGQYLLTKMEIRENSFGKRAVLCI